MYQVSVRKLGYVQASPFVRAPSGDTLSVEIVLRRSVQKLEEVVVTAEESLRRRTYHIDADAIAQSTRMLIDATDIVTKLRPDMLSGRSGECSPTWLPALHCDTRRATTRSTVIGIPRKAEARVHDRVDVRDARHADQQVEGAIESVLAAPCVERRALAGRTRHAERDAEIGERSARRIQERVTAVPFLRVTVPSHQSVISSA